MQVSVGEVLDFILPKVVDPDGANFSLTLEGLAKVIGFTDYVKGKSLRVRPTTSS
jgi:hypothetical protein